MRPRWPTTAASGHAPALAFLVLLVVGLFSDVVLGGRIFFERDVHIYWYGQIASLARCVREGSWPVWDPFVSFGEPLLANPSAQVLYPTTWICVWLGGGLAYTVYVVVHFLLAGIGLYLLAVRFGLSRPAALLAASCWLTTGPMLSLVSLWHHLAGAAFMPWCLLAADRALRVPRKGHLVGWVAAFSMQILAGSADMCAMTLLVTAAHTVWLLRSRRLGRPAAASLAAAARVMGTSIALTAALWLPALDRVTQSARWNLPPEERASWSTHPATLLQSLLPILPVDVPLSREAMGRFFDSREPFLGSLYLGLAALPLVAGAFTGTKDAFPRFLLAAVGLGALAVALGRHGGLYDALLTLLPPLRILRYPVKATVVVAWAWALLVGRGMDAWRAAPARRSWSVRTAAAAVLGTTLAASAIVLLRNPPEWLAALVHREDASEAVADVLAPAAGRVAVAAGAAVVGLGLIAIGPAAAPAAGIAVVADLMLAHRDLNPTAPATFLAPPALLPLVDPQPPTRLYVFDYGPRLLGRRYRRPPLEDAFWATPEVRRSPLVRAAELREAFFPPSAREWGLYGSYGLDLLSLDPRALVNLNLLLRASEESDDHLRLLRLGGVDAVVALHDEGLESLPLVASRASRLGRPIRVFRVTERLPRAHVVGGSRVATGAAAYRLLLDPAFDPWTEVLLGEGTERPRAAGFVGRVDVVERRHDRLRLEADLSHDGHLLVTDAYDPGWRATVDGLSRPVLRANGAFRAVAVPAGRHRVEMVYRPSAMWIGAAASATSALGLLAFAAASRRRRA